MDESQDADTVSGLLMEHSQRIHSHGDKIELEGAVVEVLEMKNDSATKVRFKLQDSADPSL